MKKYSLEHRRGGGSRCAWCWEATATGIEAHVVVSTKKEPHLELHFHRECWEQYRNLSLVELHASGAPVLAWTPQRLEALRLHSGLSLDELAKQIGVGRDRVIAFLQGDIKALSKWALTKLRHVQGRYHFEGGSSKRVDWSDPRAVFCLRMEMGLSREEFAKRIRNEAPAIARWEKAGIPKRNMLAWSQLSRLAEKEGFDGGQIVEDRAWTTEFLKHSVEASGKSQSHWARVARASRTAFIGWLSGDATITRGAAWQLTRAAQLFKMSLPPVVQDVPEDEARPRRLWTVDEVLLLGTMPDNEIADRLKRTSLSVRLLRLGLRIPPVSPEDWDGNAVDHGLTKKEVERRWEEHRRSERKRVKAKAQRTKDVHEAGEDEQA